MEEEFAILDPETLELTDRFEALQAMSRGTPVADHLVGELIASEVEVRTGKAERFPEAAALMGERRGQLLELAAAEGVEPPPPARTRGAGGRTSGSSTRRTTAATTRSFATSSGGTTRSASTSTWASAAPTAPSA